jgi:flagellar basal body-associated protein FliL
MDDAPKTNEVGQKKGSRVWIVVLVAVAAILMLCACAAAIVALVSARQYSGDVRGIIESRGEVLTAPNEATRDVQQTLAVEGAPTLVIDNQVGSVEIETGDDDQVVVQATVRAWGADEAEAERLAQQTSVQIVQAAPGRIEITAGARGEMGLGRPPQVELRITMPRQGQVRVNVPVGSVAVNHLVGTVQAQVGTGEIRASGLVMTGDCSLAVQVGSVRAELPRDSAFYLEADTDLGAIQSEFDVAGAGDGREGLEQRLSGAVGQAPAYTLTLHVGAGEVVIAAEARP